MFPSGRYLLFKFGLDEQYSSLKGTVNGLRRAATLFPGQHSSCTLSGRIVRPVKISTSGRIIRMGTLTLFQGTAAAAILGIVALTSLPARAEDFCDTSEIMSRTTNRNIAEKQVREKCRTGDIVFIDAAFLIPRLCDLREPVVRCGNTCPGGDQASFCFLAPPRQVY